MTPREQSDGMQVVGSRLPERFIRLMAGNTGIQGRLAV